jgi:hypothetical protein
VVRVGLAVLVAGCLALSPVYSGPEYEPPGGSWACVCHASPGWLAQNMKVHEAPRCEVSPRETFDPNDPVYVLLDSDRFTDFPDLIYDDPTDMVELVARVVWQCAPSGKEGTLEECLWFLTSKTIPYYQRAIKPESEGVNKAWYEEKIVYYTAVRNCVFAYMKMRADEAVKSPSS